MCGYELKFYKNGGVRLTLTVCLNRKATPMLSYPLSHVTTHYLLYDLELELNHNHNHNNP